MIVIFSLLSTAALSVVYADNGTAAVVLRKADSVFADNGTAAVVLRKAHSVFADNGTAGETNVGGVPTIGSRENDGDRGRSARQVVSDGDGNGRGQRCAQETMDEGDGDTVLEEATRTVHRYRLQPAASHYENPAAVVFREKPVAVYVRRRRPVVVVAGPVHKNYRPITAADDVRYSYYEQPPFPPTAVRGPPPVRIGVLVQDGRRRQTDGRHIVSLTSAEVSRLLRRVFSEASESHVKGNLPIFVFKKQLTQKELFFVKHEACSVQLLSF